jgi:hypothetical protein
MQTAAMLWTGGKDCSLALDEATRSFHATGTRDLLAYLEIHDLTLAAP